MSVYIHTLKQIARILDDKQDATLKQDIVNNKMDWDAIVKVGSAQLVIPTIYSRLKQQSLLEFLDKELQEYLSYIHHLNAKRNTTLLGEIKLISSWFSAAGIEHVFLKGAAMIAASYYTRIGERMLGDIDVLVPREQCQNAFDMLIEKGYTYAKTPTINPKYFEDKHLLRLTHKDHLGAIEIHFKLLDKPQDILSPIDVLKGKEIITMQSVPIPCPRHLLIHNVLNFQINDKGSYYNYFGLKNAYDSQILLKYVGQEAYKLCLKNKHIAFNFNLGQRYFKSIPKPKTHVNLKLQSKIYDLKNTYKTFNVLHYKTLSYSDLLQLLIHRSWFFICNKNYRKDIIKDRKRIVAFITSKL